MAPCPPPRLQVKCSYKADQGSPAHGLKNSSSQVHASFKPSAVRLFVRTVLRAHRC